MKTFKYISIFLVTLMILGSFSGIYATGQNVNSGKTLYVAKNGTDRNNGLNSSTPKRNIANALLSAEPGDTIQVGPGTYTENLVINKNITIIGNNQENAIIDGRNIATCVRIQPGVVVTITNFTIKNEVSPTAQGYGIGNRGGNLTVKNSTITNCGGAIFNTGVLALSHVTITNNRAESGGGINNYLGGTMTIEDSTITRNTATRGGGGIDNTGDATLRRVIIKNNHANIGGGIDTCRPLTIEDSCISDNTATEIGGGIKNDAVIWVYGCTIINNRAPDGGGIFSNYLATSYVDDVTVNAMTGNFPNNFGGKPFIPA